MIKSFVTAASISYQTVFGPQARRPVTQSELVQVNRDWSWGSRFDPHAHELLGRFFVRKASLETDRTEACDFVIDRGRVAFRVRGKRYLNWAHQVTLREGRESGSEAEFEKVLKATGPTHLLYGFEHETLPNRMGIFHFVDLEAFRLQWNSDASAFKTGVHKNRDGTSLRWICLRSTPHLIISTTHPQLQHLVRKV
jgi:hypothetical protein